MPWLLCLASAGKLRIIQGRGAVPGYYVARGVMDKPVVMNRTHALACCSPSTFTCLLKPHPHPLPYVGSQRMQLVLVVTQFIDIRKQHSCRCCA